MIKKIGFSLVVLALLFIGYRTFIRNTDVTIYGVLNQADSIGRQPIDLINMLDDEVDINFIGSVISKSELSPKVKSVLRNFNYKIGHVFVFDYVLNVWGGEGYKFDKPIYKYLSKINGLNRDEQIWIAYSMFESDSLSPHWVYELNKNYDAVVVPDSNLIPIYQNSGVTIPLFVVPLAVNYGEALTQEIKTQAHPVFTFADFGAMIDRKNTIKVLEAFKLAFGDRKDVKLILSSRGSEDLHRQKIVEFITENQMDNIDYSITKKDTKTYNDLFNQVDCYVSLSKGEGYSVQPREAMARGIPVIATDAIAQKTIADSGLVKGIHADIRKPAFYYDGEAMVGHNFDVDVNLAAQAMLDVYNNYSKYLANAQAAREWAKQYTYENIKPLFINMVKPKKIILGDHNEITKDYLMTNSKKLYKKYCSLTNSCQ